MKAALVSVLLAGCTSLPFVTPPQLESVTVAVRWSSIDEIALHCGIESIACATVGSTATPYSVIWAQRPDSFDDPRVCDLGHEFLHALGARH